MQQEEAPPAPSASNSSGSKQPSAMARIVGLIKEEASALPRKGKQRKQQQQQATTATANSDSRSKDKDSKDKDRKDKDSKDKDSKDKDSKDKDSKDKDSKDKDSKDKDSKDKDSRDKDSKDKDIKDKDSKDKDSKDKDSRDKDSKDKDIKDKDSKDKNRKDKDSKDKDSKDKDSKDKDSKDKDKIAKEKERDKDDEQEDIRGDSVKQGVRSHAAMLRYCQPGVGRKVCSTCQPADDSGCLHWNLGPLLAQQQHQHQQQQQQPSAAPGNDGSLTSRDQGRMLASAFNPMPPMVQRLHDLAAGDGDLGFEATDEAYEMLGLTAEFLHQLCTNHLAPLLPLVFKGSSATLIGAWAQETALRTAHPTLDYVISLPAWIRSNKLCMCDTAGLAQTVVRPASAGWLPFETSIHQALICGIERLVANTAAAVLLDSGESPVRPDSGRNASCNAGAGDNAATAAGWWSPKRVALPVLCHTSQGGVRPATLRLFFGAPCCLTESSDNRRLFGHLLLGFSQPRLLCLSVAEQAAMLSGAATPDHPTLRLARIVKFLVTVGQHLSLDRKEIGRPDQQLSFLAGCAVREALKKYDSADDTAFVRSNFSLRLGEILDCLQDKSRSLNYFSADWSLASLTKRPLPPTTLSLLACARSQQAPDSLLDLLLQYYRLKELPGGGGKQAASAADKLAVKIDKAMKACLTAGDR